MSIHQVFQMILILINSYKSNFESRNFERKSKFSLWSGAIGGTINIFTKDPRRISKDFHTILDQMDYKIL